MISTNQIYNGQTNEQFRGSKRLYTHTYMYIHMYTYI